MRRVVAQYDPEMFAIGVAALFGAACGAIGLLVAREPKLEDELRDARNSASRSWPTATGS